MSGDPADLFAGIKAPGEAPPEDQLEEADDSFYPGSKRRRKAVVGQQEVRGGWDDVKHVDLEVRGVLVRFYLVSVLAERLDRLPQTVRKWERQGYIPESKFRTPGRTVHGQRRIYTRPMIEGIVEIAKQEGVVGNASTRNVSATRFPQRVREMFREMGVLG